MKTLSLYSTFLKARRPQAWKNNSGQHGQQQPFSGLLSENVSISKSLCFVELGAKLAHLGRAF
jgi:hypothetical protein